MIHAYGGGSGTAIGRYVGRPEDIPELRKKMKFKIVNNVQIVSQSL